MRPNPDKLQVIEYEDYYNHSSTRRNKEKAKEGDDKESKKPDYNEVKDQQEEEIGELKEKTTNQVF